ncbi:MAG: hypothetical protein V4620_01655 [Bacteroidota bacterium]
MKRLSIIFTMITVLTFTGYSMDVNFMQYFQFQLPFALVINKPNDQTGLTTNKTILVTPDSEKFTKFLIWCNKNTHNWKSTSASYIAQVELRQENLQLLYNKNIVIIKFTDHDGKKQQYYKSVKTGELDFLTDFSYSTFSETVNGDFILTFKYPNNWAAEKSTKNSRCIGQSLMPIMDGSPTNSMMWCIRMHYISEPMDPLIAEQKNAFKGQVTEQRENIMLNGIAAIRVTLASSDTTDHYRQMIYFQKHATLFEVVNNEEASKDFETFYNSITISETK